MKRAKYFIITQNYRKMFFLFGRKKEIAISCQADILLSLFLLVNKFPQTSAEDIEI